MFALGREYCFFLAGQSELMYQRSDNLGIGSLLVLIRKQTEKMIATHGSCRSVAGVLETIGNLLVELVAVGDDDYTRIIGHILQYPLCQPDHHKTLSGTL